MKKISILSVLCLLLGGWSLWAGPVSADRALSLAGRTLASDAKTRTGAPALQVIWNGEAADSQEAPALYVIGREGGGFVIVAGDDRVYPVLAFSETGTFQVDGMPDNVRWWMERMKAYVRSVQAPEERAAEAWSPKTRATAALPESGVTNKVERLTPTWDQGNNDGNYFGKNVFNAKCPKKGSTLCVTGCVAVALGEILTWESGQADIEMPAAAHGTVTAYSPRSSGDVVPSFPYVLGTPYDWAGLRSLTGIPAIRSAVNAGNTALLDNLAQLLADLGAIVQASYNTNEGGGTSAHVNLPELIEHLDINKRAHIESQSDYTDRQWVAMLKAEIDKRPILISGQSVAAIGYYSDGTPAYAGHQFVFDGYGTYGDETVFHVNFGWGGNYNGYYRHTCLDSAVELNGRRDYSRDLEGVFDFYPDANSTYLTNLSYGSITFSGGPTVNGFYADGAVSAGQYFVLYFCISNKGVAPYNGALRIIQEDKDGNLVGQALQSYSDFSLVVGRTTAQGFYCRCNTISFGDRIVAQYASEDDPSGWAYVNSKDDGSMLGELPLMPAPFIRTEASYSVGDSFKFRLKNINSLYAGTVWTVTGPDGTKHSYAQSERECSLTQSGKYKIEAAVAESVGGTVTERVVTIINVQ